MKELIWNENAKDYIRALDKDTRREIGTFLFLLQRGNILKPPLSKKMSSIHKNAFELRISDRKGENRIIYVLALKDKILIPHAFRKKSQKTPLREIEIARRRIKEMI